MQVKVLGGHKTAFVFEDSANATSHSGERVSGARRPNEDVMLSKAEGMSDPASRSEEMQLSN